MSDPDLVDDPPRYPRPPEGGWEAVGDAVLRIYEELQQSIVDPLAPEVVLDYEHDGQLSSDQEWIVGTWFGAEALTLGLGHGNESWTNGRHRSWGLKAAGLKFAPTLLVPMCDAITLWHPDLDNGWSFDGDDLLSQRHALTEWQTSEATATWRASNTDIETRWSDVIDRWDARLGNTE